MRTTFSPASRTSKPFSKATVLDGVGHLAVGKLDADEQAHPTDVYDDVGLVGLQLAQALEQIGRRGWWSLERVLGHAELPTSRDRQRTVLGCRRSVDPCAPGPQAFMISSRAMKAPSGRLDARPFALATMLGSIKVCSTAHILPVRPMPD